MRENTEIRAKKQRLLVKCIHVLPTLGFKLVEQKGDKLPISEVRKEARIRLTLQENHTYRPHENHNVSRDIL